MVRKYINTVINLTLYLEKELQFACGRHWKGECDVQEGKLSEIGCKVETKCERMFLLTQQSRGNSCMFEVCARVCVVYS